MKAGKIILLVFMLYSGKLLAQSSFPSVEFPQIAGPPPEAAAYARYGDVPVDYSTGVPQIQIPLYTVQSKKLKVPITLSYHAGGNKVMDEATCAGLGWVINAGGIITRTVIGREDGTASQNLHYKSKPQLDSAIQYAESISANSSDVPLSQVGENIYEDHQYYDSSSDRYYYALPGGENGIFRYDIFSTTPKAIQAPYSSININTLGTYPSINGYILTDAGGTIYKFNTTGTNSWHLNKIISADHTDTISLYYDKTNSGAAIGLTQSFEIGPWWTFEEIGTCTDGTTPQYKWTRNADQENDHVDTPYPWYTNGSGTTPLIDRVESSDCIVRFYYESRLDFTSFRLSKVKVFKKATNTLIKEYDLIHSYFGSSANDNLRLRLDSVYSKNTSNATIEKYAFKYNGIELPSYTTLTNHQFHEDYWGYFNGTSSRGFIPNQFLPASSRFDTDVAANRDVDPFYAKAAILDTIYYPTGGKTIFDYESNYGAIYNYPPPYTSYTTGYAGGLRIKTITSYADATSLPKVKTYKYGDGGYFGTITADMFSYTQRYVFLNFIFGMVFEPSAEENRQIFLSTPIWPLTNSSESYGYGTVEEYDGDLINNAGKTVYSYTSLEPINPEEIITLRFKDASQFDIGIPKINLSSKYVYKNVNSAFGNYQLIYSLNNSYTTYHGTQYITGFSINKLTNYIFVPSNADSYYWPETTTSNFDWTSCNTIFPYSSLGPYSNLYFNQLESYNSIVNDEVQVLTKSTEFTDNAGQFIEKTTHYTYANLDHLQPTQITTSSSKGDSLITQYKYPHDFAGTQPYTDMVNTYHIWSPVVEQLEYKNVADSSHYLQSTLTNYASWNSNAAQIYPASVQTKKGSIANAYINRIQYQGYDTQGNIESVSRAGGPKVNYIYSYSGKYPIAQVMNADYNTIVTALGGQTAVDNFRDDPDPSDGSVNSFLASLRSLPNAQVTTYTYQPLVGMTSMTDPRGNKTAYEYDNFQRLINVKDQYGNIKTRYCYNYAGQAVGCQVAPSEVPPDPVPDPPVGLYLRVEISNVNNEYYGDEDEYSTFQTGDVCVKLYSDPACTIPLTLSYDLPFVLTEGDNILDDLGGDIAEPDYGTYTLTAGNCSYCLGNMDLDDLSHYLDEFGNPHYQEFVYHYDVTTGSTVYRDKPTVTY